MCSVVPFFIISLLWLAAVRFHLCYQNQMEKASFELIGLRADEEGKAIDDGKVVCKLCSNCCC